MSPFTLTHIFLSQDMEYNLSLSLASVYLLLSQILSSVVITLILMPYLVGFVWMGNGGRGVGQHLFFYYSGVLSGVEIMRCIMRYVEVPHHLASLHLVASDNGRLPS